jgi:hypothetical protein
MGIIYLNESRSNQTTRNNRRQLIPITNIPHRQIILRPDRLQQMLNLIERARRALLLRPRHQIQDRDPLLVRPRLAAHDEDGELPLAGAQLRDEGECGLDVLCGSEGSDGLVELVFAGAAEIHEHC